MGSFGVSGGAGPEALSAQGDEPDRIEVRFGIKPVGIKRRLAQARAGARSLSPNATLRPSGRASSSASTPSDAALASTSLLSTTGQRWLPGAISLRAGGELDVVRLTSRPKGGIDAWGRGECGNSAGRGDRPGVPDRRPKKSQFGRLRHGIHPHAVAHAVAAASRSSSRTPTRKPFRAPACSRPSPRHARWH